MISNTNIYKAAQSKPFDPLFKTPTALFRGAPFWSWNTTLRIPQLFRQIDVFNKMGIGGFHIHVRIGLNTPYLGDEFMAAVKACVDKAEQDHMLAWLYDEDRWPSGAAGGLVTVHPEHRARHLLFTPVPYAQHAGGISPDAAGALGSRAGGGKLLARYVVQLDKQDRLADFTRLADDAVAPDGSDLWYAYLEIAHPSSWFNHQTYADTLNPKAIEKFIAVTHERYKQVVGDRFGSVIPGIFTDEPQFTRKNVLASARQKRDVIMPFTDDFAQSYHAMYGEDILDKLPELFWELPDGAPSLTRYRYHDHVSERFASAFSDTIGAWCESNGLALTGHLMEEPTLESQTHALGDAMRSYRSFQLPGIDMLCDSMELTTAKQAQSASRQYGRTGMLSELYGITSWDFDFAGHKRQGDWQAALGVTLRVHHLSWVSMEGEAKRDYPASIQHQSPWWEKYSVVENHFARVNVAMTRGRPVARVAMIHPVESYWLCYGPRDQTALEREEREYTFEKATEWLLYGLMDFDFICESLLPELNAPCAEPQFTVGAMKYDAVLVPPMRTIRSTTLERLEKFVEGGGHLIFAGDAPSLVDAQASSRASALAEKSTRIAFTKSQLLRALDAYREIEALHASGDRTNTLLYQIREDGDARYVFLCNSSSKRKTDAQDVKVRLKGVWNVEHLDTSNGQASLLPAFQDRDRGWTELTWTCHAHGHLLVRLTPAQADNAQPLSPRHEGDSRAPAPVLTHLDAPLGVTLSEPNALLLDQPEWRMDGGEWQPRDEILRIDDAVRAGLNLPKRGDQMAQPWTENDDPTTLAHLDMRFRIKNETTVHAPLLAIEQPQSLTLTMDGEPIAINDCGYWVDESLRTLQLPDIEAGEHELIIRIAYHRKSNVEWCYLLGDFSVCVKGRDAVLTAPVRTLAFDDITRQGLPFYSGNITYHCTFELADAANLKLQVPHFAGAMLGVKLDAGPERDIAFAPYAVNFDRVQPGSHTLDLILYGHRHNAFGPLHWARASSLVNPGTWRTCGDQWCYEYKNLRPLGIQAAPMILIEYPPHQES